MNDYINTLVNTYPEKADEIAAIIQSIDWGKGGEKGLATLRSGLEDIGVYVD
jgi:hypothetical protein